MNNIITKETTKEEWVNQYKDYPSTLSGGLEEKPWYEGRILPIFYEIKAGSKVLDIGCNDGTFLEYLRDKKKCDVKGVDLSESMVAMAQSKKLDVIQCDAEKLPFEDHSFDVVSMMEVLSHVIDPKKVLSEIKRVLKPTGFLVGSSPHKNLEISLWDDKRLHRRYQNKEELFTELKDVFDHVDIKVLKGGQFAMSMAGSPAGEMEAEMLFKCSMNKDEVWGAYLKDKSTLRVWMGGTTNPATFYYRMGLFADKMQEMGAETFYEPHEKTDVECFHRWQMGVGPGPHKGRPLSPLIVDDLDRIFDAADITIFQITPQKGCLSFLMCAKDKYKNKPLLVELDDWIFDLPSYNHAAQAYEPRSDAERTALDQIRMSDGIICSTQYLKEMLEVLFPNKPIYVVRNAIDFDVWDNLIPLETKLSGKKEGKIRIGYTGCDNHTGDLEIIKKPIMALLAEFPNLQMVFPTPKLAWEHQHPQILVSDRWIAVDKYPSMIKGWGLDIGIAPLRDNHANRAKSNLRWLEYSALSIPTVASNVWPFKYSIKDGKNGFLVNNNANSWYDALRSLIVDQGKRIEIGKKAYKSVKESYNLKSVSKEYMELLKAIKNNESICSTGRSGTFISGRKS